MTKVLTIISCLVFMSFSSYGQADKAYSKTLQKMFKVAGTEESYHAVIKQMFTAFKQQYSNVEQDIWDELENDFLETSLKDLTEMLAPVYSKYMTKDDLKEVIKFYQTPVGKKFAQKTPFITQESMQIGQQWGMKIGQDFIKKMQERGY